MRSPVNYDLSDHVREEIVRRRIPLAVVESVLRRPQQKVPRTWRRSLLPIENRHQSEGISRAGDGE
jgi:hypothetical protein